MAIEIGELCIGPLQAEHVETKLLLGLGYCNENLFKPENANCIWAGLLVVLAVLVLDRSDQAEQVAAGHLKRAQNHVTCTFRPSILAIYSAHPAHVAYFRAPQSIAACVIVALNDLLKSVHTHRQTLYKHRAT